ncbi:LOW QUALITY PROTEIN: hypothetical protein HID58_048629 [Brassica napus]|uniref:Uncharacterized protein n=1 Tax=Brassica napus TaxID=3708 RepID=A0ABQ8B472_BRANA|nr:LOW QUALITY PROTEIN: hypothetical protein HID58_048629 [Brassica napus]
MRGRCRNERLYFGEQDRNHIRRMKSSGKHTQENSHQGKKKTREKVLKRLYKSFPPLSSLIIHKYLTQTHMRWPSHNATKILCARTFTFQFKLLGFSFTSLTHFRSPLANFADRRYAIYT